MAKNKVIFGDTTIMDITDTTAEAADVADGKVFYGNDGVRRTGTGNYGDATLFVTSDHTGASVNSVDDGSKHLTVNASTVDEGYWSVDIANSNGHTSVDTPTIEYVNNELSKKAGTTDIPTMTSELTNDGDGTHNFVTFGDEATSSEYGVIKTNPNQNIDVNASGQLEVGGRLGQTENGGLYNPVSINPENVGAYSLLMSDASGLYLGSTSFACAKGANLSLKGSHAAGSTVYRVTNSYSNRFIAAAMKGGYAALDAAAAATKTVKVTSVKFANGNDISVYSGPTESNNDIIVTLEESVNPESAATQIRGYGNMRAQSIYVGQLVGNGGNGDNGQKCLALGQGISSCANNSICVGNGIYNTQRAFLFGASLINTKQNVFMAGQNHDSRSGKNGVAAVGIASDIGATTAFAVGNGTNENNRSNIFEVCDNSGQTEVMMKSPNGTKYKLVVDDSGNLSTTAVV